MLTRHLEGSSFSLLNSLLHDVLLGPKPKDTELTGLKLLKPGALIWFSQALSHRLVSISKRIKDSVPTLEFQKFNIVSGHSSYVLEKDFKEHKSVLGSPLSSTQKTPHVVDTGWEMRGRDTWV